MDLEQRIAAYMRKEHMIKEKEHILAGVSGGADSVCLLLILSALSRTWNFKLSVLHVNHGIREEAAEDATFVEGLCTGLQIPFYVENVDVPALSKEWAESEEEAARTIRYRKFLETADRIGAEKIAVAHNRNDQAETVLLNLCRGSGLRGLAGIRPVRERIIRPLLSTTRDEIEEYLKEKNISFQTDRTNLEDTHTRNRIRHHVLPYLEEEINSASIRHISSAAGELLEAQDYLVKQAALFLEKSDLAQTKESVSVSIQQIRQQDEIVQKYIFMDLLGRITCHRKDITQAHFEALIDLCKAEDGSSAIDLPYGLRAVRRYSTLSLSMQHEKETEPALQYQMRHIEVPQGQIKDFLDKVPRLAYTKWLDYDKLITSPNFRKRKTGDRIVFDGKGHSKSLKKFLIDEKFPKDERDNVWLFADGDNVIWIVGSRLSSAYQISENTRHILEISVIL